jgi:hypothetical protein
MSDATITISKKEFNQLVEDSNFLNALREAGVDNWEGYGYACESLEKEE